jgi:hypothetical protein
MKRTLWLWPAVWLGCACAARAQTPIWETDGIVIASHANDQTDPMVLSDGAGGAFLLWNDSRSSAPGIYAQRLNALGVAQWPFAGIRVVSSNTTYTAFGDGGTGFHVVWPLSGNVTLYAQKINSSGGFLWPGGASGLAIATYPAYTKTLREGSACADGSGGIFACWVDGRFGNSDVFGQHIDANGVWTWVADGAAVCTQAGTQAEPRVVASDGGGAIFVWRDERDYGSARPLVYAQKLNSVGFAAWSPTSGVLAAGNTAGYCGGVHYEAYLALNAGIVSDGAGGVIFPFWQTRNRRRSGGSCSANYGSWTWFASGYDFAYTKYRYGDLYAVRLLSDGTAAPGWGSLPSGIAINTAWAAASGAVGGQNAGLDVSRSFFTAPDGAGGLLVAFGRKDNASNYGRRISSSTVDVQWGSARVDLWAMRVAGTGSLVFGGPGVYGIPLSTFYGVTVTGVGIVSDGGGGAYVAWTDYRNDSQGDVYAQHLSAAGEYLMPNGSPAAMGEVISQATRGQVTNSQNKPTVAASDAAYMIAAWQDKRRDPAIGGPFWDIYAGRNSPPPGRPSLIFLEDRAIINNAVARPTFYWGAANGATEYGLEIDNDIFTSLTINHTGLLASGSSGSYQLSVEENSLLEEGNFYWRVRAYNAFGSTVSEPREFMVDNSPPPAPALVAPPNGGTAGETPTFDWADVSESQ